LPRLVPLPAREIIRILKRHGFELSRTSGKGSHQVYRNEETGRVTVIAVHGGKDVPIGTLRSIIRASGIDRDEFAR